MPASHPSDRLRARLAELGPPGVATDTKPGLLEGVRRLAIQDRGQAPAWLAELVRAVETGRL